MKRFLVFVLFSLLILSGCYDSNEPNDIAYVVAIGIDENEDENFEFTVQFAKTTQISGGASEEGGKEGSNILEHISVKAPTIYAGINIANQVVSKRFTLAHTKLIVISEQVARKGVRDIFDAFGRNSDIRPNIYIAVSRGSAKEYLNAVKPVVEVNPVNYYQLIFESKHSSYVPKTNLKEFYFQLESNDKQNILPLTGVGKEETEQKEINPQEKNKKSFEYLNTDYIAGNIDVLKKNTSEVMGAAIFKGDKMINVLGGEESLVYNMLRGNFKISYVTFQNPKNPEIPVTFSLEQKKAPKISVKCEEIPQIKIKIFLEGQLISESANSPVEIDIKNTQDHVKKSTEDAVYEFLKKTTNEYASDVVGFGQWAKKNFITYKNFDDYEWTKKYTNAEFFVEVDFDLRRIGFIDLRNEKEVRNIGKRSK